MTLNSEGLLPCPFCGSEPEYLSVPGGMWVRCPVCKASSDDSNAIAAWNRRALPPVDGLEVVMEKICHKEQIGIWANEIASALAMSDFLREEWTFDDSVDLEREIAAQLLDIVKAAFTHPGLDLVASLSQASSVIAGLRSERITAERDALDAYGKLQAAEARIASLEEEIKRLREALRSAERSFNNIRGAIESNQVVDKDVHGVAVSARDAARQALEDHNG